MISAHFSDKPVANIVLLISHETEFVSVELGQDMTQLVVSGHWPQLVVLIR